MQQKVNEVFMKEYNIVKLTSGEVYQVSTVNFENYETPEQAENVLLSITSDEDTKPISSMINKTIELEEVMFTHSSGTNDDGEQYNTVRTIILTKEGEVFATNSKVFAESVATILSICGEPRTWNVTRKFKVIQVDISRGRCFKLVFTKG